MLNKIINQHAEYDVPTYLIYLYYIMKLFTDQCYSDFVCNNIF